jgi:hypothetical protein
MNEKVSWRFLFNDSRSQVYLLWSVLVTLGFVATHYFQRREINPVWAVISIIGLGFMYRVMPRRVRQMKHIFLSWAVPIVFGMVVSGLAFRVDALSDVIAYLGVFWLVVMAIGYAWNGIVDRPAGWYFFAAALNIAAALLCYFFEPFLTQQYLVAAIVSAWSLLYLWLLRT